MTKADKKHAEEMKKIDHFMSEETRKGELRRARSIAVGTSFGGTTEIMLRGHDGNVIFAILQPVETIELIHQLAANVGCHIHIKPRKDFSSWRNWKYTEEELEHYRNGGGALLSSGSGWPPHANDMSDHVDTGAKLPSPEQQPGLQPAMMARSESNEQTVATQKTVGRKRTKRAAAAA